MEIDHIWPVVAGGNHDLENLCQACNRCNGSKFDFTTGVDPQTGNEVPLYNPRIQNWLEHFQWSEDYLKIAGITPIGRATVTRLRMNDEKRIIARGYWIKLGLYPPTMV